MPFESVKQRKWMFANKPALAKRWARKYGTKTVRSRLSVIKKRVAL
jgi:hypothetical protein